MSAGSNSGCFVLYRPVTDDTHVSLILSNYSSSCASLEFKRALRARVIRNPESLILCPGLPSRNQTNARPYPTSSSTALSFRSARTVRRCGRCANINGAESEAGFRLYGILHPTSPNAARRNTRPFSLELIRAVLTGGIGASQNALISPAPGVRFADQATDQLRPPNETGIAELPAMVVSSSWSR